MGRDYAMDYMEKNFFSAEDIKKPVGHDLFGYQLVEGDEVFIYKNDYLFIKEMKKTQIELAKLMKLERKTL